MKQFLVILTLTALFGGKSYSHEDERCNSSTWTDKVTLDAIVERNGEFICQFKGFGVFRSRGTQEINCDKIVRTCGGDLEAGAKIWAKIWHGPNPICHQVCGCGGYSEISSLLGPETCTKNTDVDSLWCEQTACGCGPGCPDSPFPPINKGPYCEDYLNIPSPPPANCVNGPNWPGNKRPLIPRFF